MCVCVCVYICVCMRACVRACVHASVQTQGLGAMGLEGAEDADGRAHVPLVAVAHESRLHNAPFNTI